MEIPYLLIHDFIGHVMRLINIHSSTLESR